MKRFSYYLPVLFILMSNILYDISSKSFPKEINAQAGLIANYLFSAVVSLGLFFLTAENKNFRKELKKVNWSIFLLAVSGGVIDFGYILLFRAGWNISLGSLVCNILLAVSLIFVGILFYHEKINKCHLAGISLCLTGFALINL